MIPLTQPSGREPDDHAPVYPRLPCCRHWPFAMSEMGSACVKTKTDLVVLGKPSDPELDQFGTTVKPGRLEVLEIDDTFCAAHGGQQLAFWNAHHDERGFASMHIYHVASGTPVVAILRPARTPKGTEVRTVIKHVTKRLKRHRPTPGLSGAATVTTAASRRWTGQRTKARADGEPDQAAQGAALLRPLVVPQ